MLPLLTTLLLCTGCNDGKGLRITSVSPTIGPLNGGSVVTIHGNGFLNVRALGVSIYFNNKKAEFLGFDGDTKMMASSPGGELGTEADIQVIFGDGRQHTFVDAFRYVDTKAGFNVEALTVEK